MAHHQDEHRSGSHGRGGRGRRGRGGRGRVHRGDVRAAVLALLAEEPMHGYQIMQELIERSQGAWQPSPGSIYPTLQLLTDEGLLTARDQNGRKVFELTDDGKAAAETADGPPPWERLAATVGSVDLRHLMSTLGGAVKQVASSGTDDQIDKAAEILTETRKRLYQLLAE